MTQKKYIATNGAPFKKELAQVFGRELEKISKDNNGKMAAKDVVEAAKNPNNPLHNYFEWDDSEAANRHRLWQARNLINHLTVVVKYNGSQKEHKAFFSVNSTPTGEKMNKTYVTISKVLEEPQLREQVIKDALREIEYWKTKYEQYLELKKIFNAIEQTKKKVLPHISIE